MLDLASSPERLIDLAWLTLLHAAWLGLLAGAFASLLDALGRRASSRARHAAITAALILAAAAAPVAAVAQRWPGPRRASPPIARATAREAAPRDATATVGVVRAPADARPSDSVEGWPERLRGAIAGASSRLEFTRPYLLAGWLVGASAFAGALGAGALSLRRLGREAVPHPALERRAREFGRMLRLRRIPATREHPDIAEPCLSGGVRPMVLLPSRWLATARPAEIDAVLAHELAHARRLDHRANLVLRAIEAALFFHPGVRLAARLARREAERAADALAVRLTGDPLSLARALESVARSLPVSSRSPRPGLAIGGERPSLLLRVQELLGMKPARPRFPLRALGALPVVALLALVAKSTAPAVATQAPPSQLEVGVTGQGPPVALPAAPIGDPDDPAAADRLARVERLRDQLKDAESQSYGMGVLYRLAPGEPRRGEPAAPAEVALDSLPDEVILRLASTRPERLPHDDLLTLARTIPHGLGDSAKLSRAVLLRLAEPEQISFEVRFIQARRDPADSRPGLLENAAEPVQVVTAERLQSLVERVLREPSGAMTSAPKVTIFEGAAATVFAPAEFPTDEWERTLAKVEDGAGAPLVARLDGPLPGPDEPAPMVVIDRLHGGLYAQVGAIRKPWGHAVEARTLATLRDDPAGAKAGPRTVGRLARVNVPDGDGLLIDAGLDVVAADGDPSGPRLRTLVAVIPRHILREDEEEAVKGPVEVFPTRPADAR